MIEYLEKLITEKDYRKALEVAERMLGEGRREPKELLVINSAIFSSRYHLRDYLGAAEVGPTVIELAHRLEAWDVHGIACLDLSATYLVVDRPGDAARVLNEYLSKLRFYQEANKAESYVWFNLGYSFTRLSKFQEATQAFSRAIQVCSALGDHRFAHTARHALIGALLKTPQFAPVPKLLAQSSTYLRNNPTASDHAESKIFHLKLRAEYAVRTKRYRRARSVIGQGLMASEGKSLYQYEFHMLLAQLALELGDVSEAYAHAMAAKIHARQCSQHDREMQASSLSYRLLQMHPGALQEFKQRLVM